MISVGNKKLNIKVELVGVAEIDRMIDRMGRAFTDKEQMSAFKYALTPVKKEMQSEVSKRTRSGHLYYSIGISADMKTQSAIVGPRRKRGRWDQQGWAAHLIEWGSRAHDITAGEGKEMPIFGKGGLIGFAKTIHHPGITGRHVFSRSISASVGMVETRLVDKFERIMTKAIA